MVREKKTMKKKIATNHFELGLDRIQGQPESDDGAIASSNLLWENYEFGFKIPIGPNCASHNHVFNEDQ
ncbi:hypothetical protein V6N12_068729 [Hibiscus sabdariffa]|uniref:Uncharacterized protein n=1 Tax=Hibiscus sabdariffa TaxID=183260 RepID=A0ABR2FQU6_9ROSI